MKIFFSLLTSLLFVSVVHAQEPIVLFKQEAEVFIPGAEKIRLMGKHITFIKYSEDARPTNLLQAMAPLLASLKGYSLTLEKVENDHLGFKHERYHSSLNQIPIQGSYWVIHWKNGQIHSMNGDLMPATSESFVPSISAADAISIALRESGSGIYMWQLAQEEKWLTEITDNPLATYFPKPELCWMPQNGHLNLTWRMKIYRSEPLAHHEWFVDAKNGRVFDKYDLIHTGDVKGTAKTVYSQTKTITTDSVNPTTFRLNETGRGKGVETRNLNRGTSYGASTPFNDSDNYWNNVNSFKDEYATDAHFGAEATYDYFKQKHNRNSYDNKDAKLWSYVHYSTNYDNAFWDGQRMTYGDGNSLKPLTTLDICGHEIAHGVTSNSAQLVYRNESGALNESFSDIFGTEIEFFVKGTNGNYAIGEQSTPSGSGIRNMANPRSFQDPAEYKGPDWYSGTGDNGGVHINSGVQNHWFYILVEGKKGTNFKGKSYDVTGIGHDKASAIAYRNLTVYLGPNSNYNDACFYGIEAASDLFGSCSQEVKQTTNAWYAVAIGTAFDTIVKAGFYVKNPKTCSPTDSIIFFNTSKNAGSYLWDFGDGSTSTLKNPHYAYASQGTYNVKLTVWGCQGGTDSLTILQAVTINSSYFGCNPSKMNLNGSISLTQCQGLLQDDGGNGNYSNNANSIAIISPTASSRVKLNFLSFNMESPGDYVIIYDGNSTAAKVIGVYSGNNLPEGGTIWSSGASITLQLRSDASGTASGISVEWECYKQSANDAGVQALHLLPGREKTTLAYTSAQPIKVRIRNYGNNSISNIPVGYRINGGTAVSETATASIPAGDSITYTFKQTTDLSLPGYYQMEVWTRLSLDTMTANDTLVEIIRHIPNEPANLPYEQGFESLGPLTWNSLNIGLDTIGEMDYNNTRFGYGRMRSQAGVDFPEKGQSALTLDHFPATQTSTTNTNYLVLTLNMGNYNSDKVFLDFSYLNHGEENHTNDKVWVRGADKDAWIQVYDLFANANTNGTYKQVKGLNLSTPIKNAGKAFTTSFQVRFGQQDNGTASTTGLGDGITLDNIRIWKEELDLSIDSISNPKTECGLGIQEPIRMRIVNSGNSSFQDSVTIQTQQNGASLPNEKVWVNLTAGASTWVTLKKTLDLSAQTWHQISLNLSHSADIKPENDSLTVWAFNFPSMNSVSISSSSGQTSFCQGDSLELVASAGFNTYIWSNGKTGPSIWIKNAGNYTCTVTGTHPCQRTSNSLALTTKPKPSGGFNFLIRPDQRTVEFTQLAFNADSLFWDFGDGNTSMALNPVHVYQNGGNFPVKLTMKNKCGTFVYNYNLVLKSLSADPIGKSNFSIFPNPASQQVHISGKVLHLRIINAHGQTVNTITTSSVILTTIDVSLWAKGIYIFEVKTEEGVSYQKIQIQ